MFSKIFWKSSSNGERWKWILFLLHTQRNNIFHINELFYKQNKIFTIYEIKLLIIKETKFYYIE